MPLSHIEHYLVAADDMERTRDWYRDVLGMQEGWHPDFGFPVYWMYLDGVDVVHIGRSAKHASENQKAYLGRIGADSGTGTGAIDHIAFRAKDLKSTSGAQTAKRSISSSCTTLTASKSSSTSTPLRRWAWNRRLPLKSWRDESRPVATRSRSSPARDGYGPRRVRPISNAASMNSRSARARSGIARMSSAVATAPKKPSVCQ